MALAARVGMNRSLTCALLVALSATSIACGTADEEAATSVAAATAATSCNPGWLYCGEHHRVKSVLQSEGLSTGDVYRCNADRTVTLAERCNAGCEVMTSAENDRCLGAPPSSGTGDGDDLAVFPPHARSQTFGKDARGVVVARTAPGSLVKDPSVEYFMLAAAPLEDGATVYSEHLPIDRQGGMCETADKIRYARGGTTYLVPNPDLSAGSGGVRKLLRFDAAVLNAGTSTLRFGGPNTSVDRSTGATSNRLVDLRRFGYSACHAHDHMNGFATYRLVDAAGTPIAVGRKQGFCIGDVIQYGSGAAPIGSFVNNRCSDMQLSPGFADVYARQDSVHKRFLGGQWIDVTGVPAGEYAVEIEVNPEVPANEAGECTDGLVKCGDSCRLFCESDYSNNKARASVSIPATPCVPAAINDGGAASPDRQMSGPEGAFRARLTELSASVADQCGAISGGVACETSPTSGSEHLTARTTNGCTLRYHWERFRAGGVGQGAVELEVE